MKKYYIYRHIRLDKNEPFYIGIGTKRDNIRFSNNKAEYARAYCERKRNNIWNLITNKTEYEVEILLESDDYEFIKQKEIEFIALYGRRDLKTGVLANMTDGGGGVINTIYHTSNELKKTGQKRSEEAKQKMRGARPSVAGSNNPNFGKGMLQTTKDAIERARIARGGLSKEDRIKANELDRIEKENNKRIRDEKRRVIDTITLIIYENSKEASKETGINLNTLRGYLNGKRKNKTNLVLLKNYKK